MLIFSLLSCKSYSEETHEMERPNYITPFHWTNPGRSHSLHLLSFSLLLQLLINVWMILPLCSSLQLAEDSYANPRTHADYALREASMCLIQLIYLTYFNRKLLDGGPAKNIEYNANNKYEVMKWVDVKRMVSNGIFQLAAALGKGKSAWYSGMTRTLFIPHALSLLYMSSMYPLSPVLFPLDR